MTDRVAATDSAQACPFVAFEDERDDRSERPDPRHRCYAETPPAPRGRTHQETYCLSSAFSACPTFQAWARREAARVQVARDAQESAAVRLRDVPAKRESGAGRDAAAAASAAAATSAAAASAPSREPSSVPSIVPARDLVSNEDLANEAPEDRGRAALEVPLAGGATRVSDPASRTSSDSSSASGGRPSTSTSGNPPSSITALPPPGDSRGPLSPLDEPSDWSASDLARATPPPRRLLTDDDDDLASLLGRPPTTDRSDPGYDRSSANSVPPDLAQRRPAQGQWSAPPPWAGGPRPASEGGDPTSPGTGRPPATSSASRAADPYPNGFDANGQRVVVERPPDSRSRAPGAGLAESVAAGAVVGSAASSSAAGSSAAGSSGAATAGAVSPMAPWEADDLEPVAPLAPPQRSSSLATLLGWDRRPRAGSSRPSRMASQPEPAWERPRRYEAYPTIRTRVGLPAMSKAAIAGIAVLVGALALFFLPPLLLHQGGAAPGASESIAPSSSIGPSHSVGPTAVPAKTPLTYAVKSGDTLVKIAKKYNLTVEQLLAANKQIKNPNKIAIGDVLNIPQSTPSQIIDGGPSGSP